MNIVVVGSSNTDMIIKTPHIPSPGETVLGGEFTTAAGGKGANQAVAASRAGGQVTFVAKIGRDMFGDKALEGFKKDHIDVSHIIRDPKAPSGVAEIFVSNSGENSIAVASGANANLNPDDIRLAESAIASADILVMQLEIPLETVQFTATIAHKHKIVTILDPAPAQTLPDELLRSIDIITPNETETEILTGISIKNDQNAKQAADLLHAKGVHTVIITLGSRGVFVSDSRKINHISGYSVQAVDTTAAGDVFNGALAVGISEKQSLEDAVKFANAAAALSVTQLGAQPSAPTREDILNLMKS